MKRKIIGTVVALSFWLMMPLSASALTWVEDNRELIGADGVEVNGFLYDVRFVGGSCIEVFNSCRDFTFHTPFEAQLASQALLDQVLINDQGARQPYDVLPGLTHTGQPFNDLFMPLRILTPWMPVFDPYAVGVALNSSFEREDRVSDGRDLPHLNPFTDPWTWQRPTVWAVWSPAQPVPEPTTSLLFAIGIVGLMGARSRRQKR
ncbi:PEP-CTERM sorting domain-containing protein [Desulfogranum mediterraneum]|uniref:PEP-CTERM sorting domain-containing protein n=1 Tax=Desulfogranum mediterraneum TaxID=160661 RepID=UPI00042172C5|nr:PEP-CTERM sorting domain-containing protein [Desulfogranum mediterraneum]